MSRRTSCRNGCLAARPGRARFLRHAGLIAGVRPRIEGAPLEPHTLVIANHTSWLDILILGGWAGHAPSFPRPRSSGHAVARLDRRPEPHALHRPRRTRGMRIGQVEQITEALEHHQPLAVFPEGHDRRAAATCCRSARPCWKRSPRRRPVSASGRSRSTMATMPMSSAGIAASRAWPTSSGCSAIAARWPSTSACSTRCRRPTTAKRWPGKPARRSPPPSLPCAAPDAL